AARHRVVKMIIQAVVVLDHARRAAFRRYSVAAHRIDLGDETDAERRIGFGRSDGCPQPRAARANDRYIGGDDIHHYSACVAAGPALVQKTNVKENEGGHFDLNQSAEPLSRSWWPVSP